VSGVVVPWGCGSHANAHVPEHDRSCKQTHQGLDNTDAASHEASSQLSPISRSERTVSQISLMQCLCVHMDMPCDIPEMAPGQLSHYMAQPYSATPILLQHCESLYVQHSTLTSKEAWHEEVKEAPQLQGAVLYGCAAQHEPVLGLQPLDSLTQTTAGTTACDTFSTAYSIQQLRRSVKRHRTGLSHAWYINRSGCWVQARQDRLNQADMPEWPLPWWRPQSNLRVGTQDSQPIENPSPLVTCNGPSCQCFPSHL